MNKPKPEFDHVQSRYIIVTQSLVPMLLNIGCNALVSWALWRNHSQLTLWGEGSFVGGFAFDLLLTAFLITFITSFFVTSATRKKIERGELPLIPREQTRERGFERYPTVIRGVWIGMLAVLFGALPLIAFIHLELVTPTTVNSFVFLKAIWAGVVAAVVSPILTVIGMLRASIDTYEAEGARTRPVSGA